MHSARLSVDCTEYNLAVLHCAVTVKLVLIMFVLVCSLCTMLSLQWEPEIIAVAVMYLAGRLCKFDIQEWTAKQSSRRWWEQFVQDVPVELLEGAHRRLITFVSSDSSRSKCVLSSRHLPPDPGPVLPGEQAHPSADTGKGADAGCSHLCSSNTTGTAPSRQPTSPTAKKDISTRWQPCAAAQTLTCKNMIKRKV